MAAKIKNKTPGSGAKAKVLVTGATGFVGANLAERLVREGYKVRALVRKTSNASHLENLGIELAYGDITDERAVRAAVHGTEIVFHVAGALASVVPDENKLMKINAEGTTNIIHACKAEGVQHLIHCSTGGVLGFPAKLPADESFPYRPVTAYERSKAEAEKRVLAAVGAGLNVTVLRPVLIYGPRDTANLLPLFRGINKGYFFIVGGGKNTLHPIYIDNLVDAFLLVAGNEKAYGQVYMVLDEHAVTMDDFAGAIAHSLKKRAPVHLPLVFAKLAGTAFDAVRRVTGINFPLSRDRVNFLTSDFAYSGRKLAELGYMPKISTEQGVYRTAKWYAENKLV
ncbi:MAG: NAD-dependent epimerase/dehydratase family protein [Candidatus Diapherotrites archaeon]|nr:NAD-dependent epimerase/dehydratase family protein [Candidatus Micrarchaeota archaeon]MBU1939483.1 NAD-dependent epimerase/dehydratase family protein [Candidatus Micrarchaeota archaeon]